MPTIYIKNGELESIMVCIGNARHRAEQKSSGINGLTSLKVSKILKDLQKEKEDYDENKKKLLDDHVKGGSESPETESNGRYIFKSKQDEKDFLKVSDAYAEVRVRDLLADSDLEQLLTMGMEIEFISRVTESEANFNKPKEKKEEKEEEVKEKKTSKKPKEEKAED